MLVLPYKEGSESAKNLAVNLNAKLLKSNSNSRFFKSPILNWGNSKRILASLGSVLNNPKRVRKAVNKLEAFKVFKACEVSIPDFTTDYEVAKCWIEDENMVVARALLESHSGNGITLAKTIEELPIDSKVYVKYFPKMYEFRVHVFNGKVIDYVQKRKRDGLDESQGYNKYIRSHSNGWVFCRDNAMVKDHVKTLAVKAVNALRLDFGAADVAMMSNGKAVVLEVNTAPALQGTTLEIYTNAIKEWINEER